MGGSGSDELAFEQTWLMLDLPAHGEAPAPDATIRATRPPVRARPLPRISVDENPTAGAREAETAADLVVVRALGEGGMGRVQLARQESLDREVALKRPRAGAGERDGRALRAEGLVAGHLEHPNIVPIHALGLDDAGQPVIVMKRVEGVAWRELLHDDGHPGWASREPLPEARLVWHLQTLVQLCNAIAYAHSRGIIHRDVKPNNVMIGEFGEVYLLDWGAAAGAGERARTQGDRPVLVGTPVYMAPEMVTGDSIDERTDVYLLGATLHEILTRRVRHPGAALHAVLFSAFMSSPVSYSDDVPAELADLANRATSRDPDRRPPGALAFRQALLDHLRHRASLGMSAAAGELLVEVERAIAAGTFDQPIESRLEECRFGLRQAMRAWPDSPEAAAGLERCAAAMVHLEIARSNPDGARGALAQLANPPAELRQALELLERRIAAEQVERSELRQLARDLDLAAGGRSRAFIVLIVLLLTIGISAYGLPIEYAGSGISRMQMLVFPSVILVGTVVLLIALRRRLLVSAINRRLAAWLFVMLGMLMMSRVVGTIWELSVPHQHVTDQILLTACLASCAAFVLPWMWICAAVMGAGALAGAVAPRIAFLSFAICVPVVLLITATLLPSRPTTQQGRPS